MTSSTRGWFDSKELWDDLGALLQLYEKRAATMTRYESEIAVIIDEESALHTHWNQGTRDLLYNSRMDLLRIGSPVGFYLLDDLIAGKVPEAKMYVFLNAFYISPERRRAIRSEVAKDGKTAVWYCAPGFVAESTGTATMEALTGIAFKRLPTAIAPELVITKAGSELLGEVQAGEVFVIKRGPGWTSVFVGSHRLPSGILRRLAVAAGVHIWLDSDDLVVGDGEFLAVHAGGAGRKTICLPKRGVVTDAVSGEWVVDDVAQFEVKMRHGETRLFLIRLPRSDRLFRRGPVP